MSTKSAQQKVSATGSVPRYLGTETEFGISTPDDGTLSPIVSSTHAVVAYGQLHTKQRSRWDFADESPLRDSRGFDLRRYRTAPVIDANALGVANVVTPNGGRFYVDHAHPEYSTPECPDAFQALIHEVAGDLIVNQARQDLAQLTEQNVSVLSGHAPCPAVKFYRNNVDGKGASFGYHENYQYERSIDFDVLAQALIPFFVARQVITGAGRVGLGERGEESGFQISQRADYICQEISLETTMNRGIINTRDEPHANPDRFGRLHVIVGDATMSHTATLIKLGFTRLVIDAVHAGTDFSDLRLADAVPELKAVSRDLSLSHRMILADGRELTAVELLEVYRERVGALPGLTTVDDEVLSQVDEALVALANDPFQAADMLDWVAKLALIRSYQRRGVADDDPKLKLIDLQYSDVDPAKSLYAALVRAGRMRTLVTPEQAQAAVHTPPEASRAYFRGRVSETFASHIASINWQSVVLLDATETTRRADHMEYRFALDDLDRLGRAEVEECFDGLSGDDVAGLASRIADLGIDVEITNAKRSADPGRR